jgi:ribosome-associated protein
MPVYVSDQLLIGDDELEWRFTPSGGPGGQHANKANTRVELSWDLASSASLTERQRTRLRARLGDTVRVVADDHRSQYRNRMVAGERLAEMCRRALAPPPKPRKPTKPSRGARKRRLESKRRAGQTKRLRRKPGLDD